MIVDHTNKDIYKLESLITKADGTPLYGEIEMYRRITNDCTGSSDIWHFWHDITLNIPSSKASEIQIDFLLVSKYGAIVIEVKGGPIEIISGHFFYRNKGNLIPMKLSPFKQADNYKWALINNKVINGEEVFIDSICAFPDAELDRTSDNPAQDLSYKMWNKDKQDSDASFTEFCKNILTEDKHRKHWTGQNLSETSLKSVIDNLAPTVIDPGRYSQSSMQEILNWLHIENLDTLESLQKNHRIIIEGGPGTGKTTIAKAYIKKHKGLHGLYLCWTKFLAAKVKHILQADDLTKCDVESYASFLYQTSNGDISLDNLANTNTQALDEAIRKLLMDKHYDYVIIDEAQDVTDKGMIAVLDMLTSIYHTGTRTGRFLVLYDLEQGYNSGSRNLESAINELSSSAAHFTLNGNKRVPTNIEISEYAEKLMNISMDELESFWNSLDTDHNKAFSINLYSDTVALRTAVAAKRRELIDHRLDNISSILVHSDFCAPLQGKEDSLYNELNYANTIQEITTDNICCLPKGRIGLTSILKYKGLENHHIILVIPARPIKSSYENFLFEIYVGMTRAIMNLDIFVLNI